MVVAVKAKGFSLFPGIAGKCSPPTAGSLASGVVEGSGMPSAEQESTPQNPGSAGRAVEMEWWLTSHSVSPSLGISGAPTVCRALCQAMGHREK